MFYERVPAHRRAPRWLVEGIGPVRRLRDAKGKAPGKFHGPHFKRQITIGNVLISTVGDWWMGSVGGTRMPLGPTYETPESLDAWYETMAFVAGEPEITRRYLTQAAALAGHYEVVGFFRTLYAARQRGLCIMDIGMRHPTSQEDAVLGVETETGGAL